MAEAGVLGAVVGGKGGAQLANAPQALELGGVHQIQSHRCRTTMIPCTGSIKAFSIPRPPAADGGAAYMAMPPLGLMTWPVT